MCEEQIYKTNTSFEWTMPKLEKGGIAFRTLIVITVAVQHHSQKTYRILHDLNKKRRI